jgi:hypothetical protein
MNTKRLAALVFLFGLLAAALAACGGGAEEPPAPPTPDAQGQIANSVQQTVAAIAVAQTVAALTGANTPTPVPGQENLPTAEPLVGDGSVGDGSVATPTAAPATNPPTAESSNPPSPTIAQSPPVEEASCRVLSGINLRAGPGTVYEPPVGSVGAETTLRPLAYSPVGYPQGAWILAEIVGSGQVAWVTAGPQFVRCNIDPATLPPAAVIPPTPRPAATNTPPPTNTPQPVAALPPDLRNVSGGAGCLDDDEIDSDFQTDSRFLLRVFAELFNPPPDESGDGAGIDRVEFSVDEVGFSHTENNAGYCIFQGGEPTCRDWPRDSQGRLTWGEGGPIVVDGDYEIDVIVFPEEDTNVFECNWTISLTIDVP